MWNTDHNTIAATITMSDNNMNKATTFVSFDEGHLPNSGDVSESVREIRDREKRTFFRAFGVPENHLWVSKQTVHNTGWSPNMIF